ncbi:GIY-YIG nuclease family protein [Streptomyces sp. MBT49]|uniref:GIY-YIG nuclease family protein n=1 Tax=unclassified Streptomyces TaxID=2593676 RepID=UPI00190B8D0E|nr:MULTISPECIES: GIY-YIG nuclease family protein [unclassified Streptomyces]MBK3625475.1 GIY-YIG nuclease family protein [Streptomyces sp. MBT49]MBK3633263.1 GIY-YIG nuclease family protein [Streptomyces sp. MBT97]
MIKQTTTGRERSVEAPVLPVHLPMRQLDRENPLSALLIPRGLNSNEYLYRFYDGARRPLYIGRSGVLSVRIQNHRRNSSWWGEAEFLALSVYASADDLAEAERAALRAERPRSNKATVLGPENARLPLRDAETAAAVLFREALPEFVAELAELLMRPERFPQPEPPPPAA